MSQFTQPDYGNSKRIGSPVNSVRNLQCKLNRQARVAKLDAELKDLARDTRAGAIAKGMG